MNLMRELCKCEPWHHIINIVLIYFCHILAVLTQFHQFKYSSVQTYTNAFVNFPMLAWAIVTDKTQGTCAVSELELEKMKLMTVVDNATFEYYDKTEDHLDRDRGNCFSKCHWQHLDVHLNLNPNIYRKSDQDKGKLEMWPSRSFCLTYKEVSWFRRGFISRAVSWV